MRPPCFPLTGSLMDGGERMILYRERIERNKSTLSNGKGIIGEERKKVLILLFIWPVVDGR